MFVPLEKEDLKKEPFVKNEILFSLLHRLNDLETEVALKTPDNNMIALCTPGRSMWLWINEELGLNEKSELLVRLAGELLFKNITGIIATKDIAGGFAACYAELRNAEYKKGHGLIAYSCPVVIKPVNVRGKMIPASFEHTEIVTECVAGFSEDAHGVEAEFEKCIASAKEFIESGDLYLWYVDGEVTSTAKIGQRVYGQARINSVYTFPDKRKNGYCSALVAGLSQIALDAGLIPVLYTDMTNPDSNKVYTNIGYIEEGRLDSYDFIF